MRAVDLNCDMGEGFTQDRELLSYITSANIACAFHAGDPTVMDRTVALACQQGVAVGAHPSFPDLHGFGRRHMLMQKEDLNAVLVYQIGALQAFARRHGTKVQHVKLHGALYNMAVDERALAETVAECVAAIDKNLIIVALFNSEMYRAALNIGLKAAAEFFADRHYDSQGRLLPRTHPNALITDEAEAVNRCIRAVTEGTIEAFDGSILNIRADTVCLHSDNPSALHFAALIQSAIIKQGIILKPMGTFL